MIIRRETSFVSPLVDRDEKLQIVSTLAVAEETDLKRWELSIQFLFFLPVFCRRRLPLFKTS